MADDDIDIEEHDLFDNPLVKSMFPDLSILKKEILDFDVPEPVNDITLKPIKCEKRKEYQVPAADTILKNVKREPNVKPYCNREKIQKTDNLEIISKDKNEVNNKVSPSIVGKFESNTFSNVKTNDVETKSSPVRFPKALKKTTKFLMTKPNDNANNDKTTSKTFPKELKKTTKPTIKESVKNLIDNSSCTNNDANIVSKKRKRKSEEQNSNSPIKQTSKENKIILGSKPNTDSEVSKNIISKNVKVSLENLERFLNKSSRYCKVCLRLFPSNKTLTDHNNAIHSQTDSKVLDESHQDKDSSVIGNSDKCELCKTVHSSSSCLIKHKTNDQRKKDQTSIVSTLDDTAHKETKTFNCKHCNKNFASQQFLIEHMYYVLQSKNNVVSDYDNKKECNDKIKLSSSKDYYRCNFCSYYFKTQNRYISHVKNRHKKTVTKKPKKIAFDPTCHLCHRRYVHIMSFNGHVWKYHIYTTADNGKLCIDGEKNETKCKESYVKDNLQDDISNDLKKSNKKTKVVKEPQKILENLYILKSVLFKCVKCDVCFLSGGKATAHDKHMDQLINWKCLKCLRIFKKEDEMLHKCQHLFSDIFDVFEIRPTSLLSLLYKCPNCITYFFENDLFSHYSCCKKKPPRSAYCKICDILIDVKVEEVHNEHHNIVGKELTNIFIESDIIEYCTDTDGIGTEGEMEKDKKSSINNTVELKKGVKIEEKLKTDSDSDSKIYIDAQKEQMLSFIYCNKCNSFISKIHKLYYHTKDPCSNLISFVCKDCGLIISNKYISHHRKMHQRIPGLTLNQLKFFDLKSRKMSRPPIPKYPNCNKCLKHFITKTAIISHKCSESYLTCNICDIKFSVSAYSLHMAFHHYSPTNEASKITKNETHIVSSFFL